MFEIVTTSLGVKSIRNSVVNEIMHNPVGPWIEANQLYIQQSKLVDALKSDSAEPYVIFDVGLGAAANALAVLHCVQSMKAHRPIQLVSFERDLELLKFALLNSSEFEHFIGYESAIQTLLDYGTWAAPGVEWTLREGNFVDLIKSEAFKPHMIFFDPYSPEVNKEMWTLDVFKSLKKISRSEAEGGTLLLTYSRSTPVRVAMLAAGFIVGVGQATGLKDETTQAATVRSLLREPLGKRWLERWRRSHTPYPIDLPEADQAQLRYTILSHPQF